MNKPFEIGDCVKISKSCRKEIGDQLDKLQAMLEKLNDTSTPGPNGGIHIDEWVAINKLRNRIAGYSSYLLARPSLGTIVRVIEFEEEWGYIVHWHITEKSGKDPHKNLERANV